MGNGQADRRSTTETGLLWRASTNTPTTLPRAEKFGLFSIFSHNGSIYKPRSFFEWYTRDSGYNDIG